MTHASDATSTRGRGSATSSLGGLATLWAGVAFVLLQLLSISGIAFGVKRMHDAGDDAVRLEAGSSEVDRLQRAVMEVLITDGSSSSRRMVGDALDRLATLHAQGVLDSALSTTKLDWNQLRQAATRFREGKDMSVANVEAMVELGRFSRQSTKLGEAMSAEATKGWARAEGTRRNTLYVIALAGILNGLGTACIYWLFYRRVTRPLRYAGEVAAALARGDFSQRIERDGGEATSLLRALQEVQQQLGTMIAEIRAAAESVLRAASDIAAGNSDLASRTEAQASTLEETASSMEELTSAVEQNSDSAQTADRLARDASGVATKAGNVMGDMTARMDGITSASRRISEITGMIDAIAFQTNILALNAAVEAARAGDQGRGFAVVAAEVRTLAQRSAAAAKEIKTLIDTATGEVAAGTTLATHARKTMSEVVESVRQVTDLIGSIAAASREQNGGIGQVNTAVAHMESAVQENAALVQQAADGTNQLREQADALLKSISRFRLASDLAAAGPRVDTTRDAELVLPFPRKDGAVRPQLAR